MVSSATALLGCPVIKCKVKVKSWLRVLVVVLASSFSFKQNQQPAAAGGAKRTSGPVYLLSVTALYLALKTIQG